MHKMALQSDVNHLEKIRGMRPEDYGSALMAYASLVIVVGAHWDFWWHLNVGRHNFWIPPHLLIYSSVILLILGTVTSVAKTGFELKNRYGIIVAGIIGLLIAAAWDDWWHTAYEADIPIVDVTRQGVGAITPPHALAVLSSLTIGIGILMDVAIRYENHRSKFNKLMLSTYYAAGLSTVMFASILFDPYSLNPDLRLLGSVSFGLLPTALMVAASRYMQCHEIITYMATITGLLHALGTSNLAYVPMFLVSGMMLDILSWKTSYFKTKVYGATGGFFWSILAFSTYVLIQPHKLGLLSTQTSLLQVLMGGFFGALGGIVGVITIKSGVHDKGRAQEEALTSSYIIAALDRDDLERGA